jgi:hypothetical protein
LCCSIGLGVVFDPRSRTHYPPYELMSRNWYVPFCCTWYQEKRWPCRSIPDEKSKTIPVPGGAVLSLFQVESQLRPGLESGTQRVRHSSPYCPQNSAYADWFCPGGSVCSVPRTFVLVLYLRNLTANTMHCVAIWLVPRNIHLDTQWVCERWNRSQKSDRLEQY